MKHILLLASIFFTIVHALPFETEQLAEIFAPDHVADEAHKVYEHAALYPVSNARITNNVTVELPSTSLISGTWVPVIALPTQGEAQTCALSRGSKLKSIILKKYSGKDMTQSRGESITACQSQIRSTAESVQSLQVLGLTPSQIMGHTFEIKLPPKTTEEAETEEPPVYQFVFSWTGNTAPCAFKESSLFYLNQE